MPLLLLLRNGMPAIDTAAWGALVCAARDDCEADDVGRLTRVLFLLTATGQPRASELSPEAQDIIATALADPRGDIAQCAAHLIRLADDAALDDVRACLDDDLNTPGAIEAIDSAAAAGHGVADAAKLLGVTL